MSLFLQMTLPPLLLLLLLSVVSVGFIMTVATRASPPRRRSERDVTSFVAKYVRAKRQALRESDDFDLECLDHERAIKTTGGTVVCADKRCLRDPSYFEIHFAKNRLDLKGLVRVPALLKICDAHTLRLVFRDNDEPRYASVKEYVFRASGVFAVAVIPSHVYVSVWDERTKRRYAEIAFPKSSLDLLPRGAKLRVSLDAYARLLDFCRFSIHTHVVGAKNRGAAVICCKRSCSRPEPLTADELAAVRSVAKNEPYYTCSWLEKRVLFKWHVGEERFEPYWSFDCAIGAYNDPYNRHDPRAFKLFAFDRWKIPDETLTNADEIYFRSATDLAGYKWYEPTAADEENDERYADGGSDRLRVDETSSRISTRVMNLAHLPEGVLLSSALIRPHSFDAGVEFKEDAFVALRP